jgi:SAM-dependent methyltransferase
LSDSPFQSRSGWRPLAYRLLWAAAGALQRASNACLYTAAGLLRRVDLEIASRRHWRGFSNELEHVDAGLEIWEKRLFDAALRPGDRVLLVGCGTGRDLLALASLGFAVDGIDPSPDAIAAARGHLARHGLSAGLAVGFIEQAALPDSYDAIVFSNCCYSYVQGARVRIETLGQLAARLKPSGRLAISYTGQRQPSGWPAILATATGGISRADWRAERGDSFTRSYLAANVLKYEHVFAPGEVAKEAAAAGLRVVRDEAPPGSVPWVLATKG